MAWWLPLRSRSFISSYGSTSPTTCTPACSYGGLPAAKASWRTHWVNGSQTTGHRSSIPNRSRTSARSASVVTGVMVSHNDVHPANVVFRGGRAVALIDFDLAGPGSAAWDLATAARNWAPLQDDRDVTDCRQGRAIERFRIFLDAYELTRAERRQVAEAIVANHDWTYAIVTEAAAAGHQGFADYWQKAGEPTVRARRWCLRHQRDLLAATR
jgi:Ser/Thr protein kinase RdoA (MazF antagonist)